MAVPGSLYRSIIGADNVVTAIALNGGATTFAMASLNTCWAARFMAGDTRDILSVYVNWSSVASAGTVTLRIETIDATTGKPTGSLYDANATLAFTPVAGWQLLTFASAPTTGLTAGTEYAILLITTTGGTTQTLRASVAAGAYPTMVQTAADGTTRSNLTDTTSGVPICTAIFEDSVEETLDFCQFATISNYNIFGTAAAGVKFVVPVNLTFLVDGIDMPYVLRTGTPAGDLRVRIFNSADTAVSGTTITIDKDSVLGGSGRRWKARFGAPVSLAAGTYRIVLDSASSANSSNCYTIVAGVARAAANVPTNLNATNTADVTAGTISWTDTNTQQMAMGLLLDSISGSGGGVVAPTWNFGQQGVLIG